jgi:hypothetical protein
LLSDGVVVVVVVVVVAVAVAAGVVHVALYYQDAGRQCWEAVEESRLETRLIATEG